MITTHVRFNDHSKEFTSRVAVFADTFIALMAVGIENQMKTSGKVPFLPKSTKWAQRGALRTSIRSRKMAVGHYVVTAGENSPAGAYAAAQEAGVSRGHIMKNYSTPGTGPHWFKDAIDTTRGRASEHLNTAKKAAGIGGNL